MVLNVVRLAVLVVFVDGASRSDAKVELASSSHKLMRREVRKRQRERAREQASEHLTAVQKSLQRVKHGILAEPKEEQKEETVPQASFLQVQFPRRRRGTSIDDLEEQNERNQDRLSEQHERNQDEVSGEKLEEKKRLAASNWEKLTGQIYDHTGIPVPSWQNVTGCFSNTSKCFQDISTAIFGEIPPLPTLPPNEYAMFNWDAGGAWDGERNDINAEVGFEFTPSKDLNLTALGRHVPGHWKQRDTKKGIDLFETTNVTLWYVMPEGSKLRAGLKREGFAPNGLKLLEMPVGPGSNLSAGGKYAFTFLEHPFFLHAHEKYMITQTCWAGMKDVWFDQTPYKNDLDSYLNSECLEIGRGVHSGAKHMYPLLKEKEFRRAGMLNIRISLEDDVCGVAMNNVLVEAAQAQSSSALGLASLGTV